MLIDDVRPSSLEGIKSLANQFRRQVGIKHSAALDLAAKAAGYTNFKHAQRTRTVLGFLSEKPYLMLTIYWRDRDKSHEIGRETLDISLHKPILEICSKYELKQLRGFGNLRMVSADHLVCDLISGSQEFARAQLTTAARSLRFLEHTGLRPRRQIGRKDPNDRIAYDLPGVDHATEWTDPANGQFILIDEPYPHGLDEQRASWAKHTGWRVAKTSWPGMYFPHNCDLNVVTDARSGYDIDALVATINAMPAPMLETDWRGDSSSSWKTFTSPMAKTPHDVRRARCRGTIYPSATKATVPCSYNMGSHRRRPAAEMPVEDHIEVGSMIKAILRSRERPFGVYDRLNTMRSTLEDWMSSEIRSRQLNGPEFFDVYYNETEHDAPYREKAQSCAGIVRMLQDLKTKLQTIYPDCGPLRQQIHKIDISMKLIAQMKPKP